MSATTRRLIVAALGVVVARALRADLRRSSSRRDGGRPRTEGRAPATAHRPAEEPRPRRPAPTPDGARRDDEEPGRRPGFLTLLLVLGAALLVVAAADLLVRGPERVPTRARWTIPGADPERGRAAILRHGCGSCHVIPGVRGARGRVGPQLVGFADQMYVAGVLANVPENLVRWLRHPRAVDPLTAMPDVGLSEQEARDVAAYLYERS